MDLPKRQIKALVQAVFITLFCFGLFISGETTANAAVQNDVQQNTGQTAAQADDTVEKPAELDGAAFKYFAPVLIYHDVKENAGGVLGDISAESFGKQLDWLAEHGYRTLSMEEYINCIETESFTQDSVLITFDDGYEGVYKYVLPELRKHNMKATVFIIPDRINREYTNYPYLDIKELMELANDEHISIGSHTMDHPADLRTLTPEELQYEFQQSKELLERLTQKPCLALAYPCGNNDEMVVHAAVAAGYKAAFNTTLSDNYGCDIRYTIPRICIKPWACADDNAYFKYIMHYYPQNTPGVWYY